MRVGHPVLITVAFVGLCFALVAGAPTPMNSSSLRERSASARYSHERYSREDIPSWSGHENDQDSLVDPIYRDRFAPTTHQVPLPSRNLRSDQQVVHSPPLPSHVPFPSRRVRRATPGTPRRRQTIAIEGTGHLRQIRTPSRRSEEASSQAGGMDDQESYFTPRAGSVSSTSFSGLRTYLEDDGDVKSTLSGSERRDQRMRDDYEPSSSDSQRNPSPSPSVTPRSQVDYLINHIRQLRLHPDYQQRRATAISPNQQEYSPEETEAIYLAQQEGNYF